MAEQEQSDMEKRNQEVIRLRDDLHNAEQQLTQEHAERLRLQREQKELSGTLAAAQAQIKGLETQGIKYKAQLDAYRSEILGLRSENQQLSQKHNEETWVAKSEYSKLKKDYEVLEHELKKYKPPANG